jgi:hypothetical protein
MTISCCSTAEHDYSMLQHSRTSHTQCNGANTPIHAHCNHRGVPDRPTLEGPRGAAEKSTESSPLELLAPPSSAGPEAVATKGPSADSNALALKPEDGAGPLAAAVGEMAISEEPFRTRKAAHPAHWQHVYPIKIPKWRASTIPAPKIIAATNPAATRIQLMSPAADT